MTAFQALEDAFNRLYPGKFKCSIVDIWTDHAAWPYTNFVPAYKFLAKHPILWRLFWIYGKFPLTRWFQEKITLLSCFGRFKRVSGCALDWIHDVFVSASCIQLSSCYFLQRVYPLCFARPLICSWKQKKITAGLGTSLFLTFVSVLPSLAPSPPPPFSSF